MDNKKFFVEDAAKIIPPLNDSPYKRILAIGDIHGCFDKFISLWKKISATDDDFIIFLGDYIDRGNKVAEVLEWVMAHATQKNFIFLRGNHEQMMLDAFDNPADVPQWTINGGKTTISGLEKINSYDKTFLDRFLKFAENLPLYHAMTIGGREYIFVHAGIDSKVPLNLQKKNFMLWARAEFFNTYDGDAVIVSGHSPLQLLFDFGDVAPRPIKFPDKNILMIDTGSFIPSGKISCVDILSGEFWQSDDKI